MKRPKQPRRLHKPTVVVLLAAVMLASFGSVSRWRDGGRPADADPVVAGADDHVAFWAARADQDNLDYLSRTNLAAAHLGAARITGDLDGYAAAIDVLDDALGLNPQYGPAHATLAAAELGRHHFGPALDAAETALRYEPSSLEALAAAGDAHLELGDYERAAEVYTRLHLRQPGPAAEARLARLAFLRGDSDEAVARAERALDLAGPDADPSYHNALAVLAMDAGMLQLAVEAGEAGLRHFPEAPSVIETLAQVRAGTGDLDGAVGLYQRLLASGPDPAAHGALGDLYTRLGRDDEAEAQYARVEPSAAVITDDPAIFDREIAMFLADHRLDPDRAVDIARRDVANRQDVYAFDTLAWALHQAGMSDEAVEPMASAMALGTADPHLLYHAGMIAAGVGDDRLARHYLQEALAINPHFDTMQAPLAVETLRRLD